MESPAVAAEPAIGDFDGRNQPHQRADDAGPEMAADGSASRVRRTERFFALAGRPSRQVVSVPDRALQAPCNEVSADGHCGGGTGWR